ncbi:DNA cytosine methyltransferase [Candidatus Methylospira mobilis]|uniref:Cytosine-specific methyltransferase n=1 Tax=Candidatus Methylospira mobilis TaxID=1808979 RepID=A0A5Q0BP58_9GAMM|nr:DNA cytosine methyltransferase [Candidatus Methylospira mobilis]QFY43526.1 DNA cytosine methyltransferase [Candidatus Methylospira mobilis]
MVVVDQHTTLDSKRITDENNRLGCDCFDVSNRWLTCIDLFAGAGGFSLAAKNVGINVVAAVEFNPNACKTYTTNLVEAGIPHLYNVDIRALNPLTIAVNHFPDGNGCDILLGGPPCQGFSVHRINDSGIDDPRNELILRYFDFVGHLRPKVFLMENVPGLLWQRHRHFLDEFYRQARESGYLLRQPEILDARDYGVPQRRKRVFVLGVRRDIDLTIDWPPCPTHGDDKARLANPVLQPWLTASAVFNSPVCIGDKNNVHMNHTSALVDVFRRTPPNGGSRKDSGRILSCHVNHNGHRDVYGRIDPNQPGPTMTTACINPSKGRFVHPTEHHGITLRQAARFQTFPDWFVFNGGLIAGGEQIGNAVPVRLGEVLLRTIKEALLAWERSHD